MSAHRGQIAAAQVVRLSQVLVTILQADEFDHAIQIKIQLVMMHDMEQDDLMVIVAEALYHRLKLIEVPKKVTKDHDDLAATKTARDVAQAAVEGRFLYRLDLVEVLRHPQHLRHRVTWRHDTPYTV